MLKGQKDSPPGAMHRPETGSPSNPINERTTWEMTIQPLPNPTPHPTPDKDTMKAFVTTLHTAKTAVGAIIAHTIAKPTIAPTVTVVHRDIVSIGVPSAGKTRIGF
ncbi:hypothetical protein SERLA73DRAFT_72275 [Serpula lacrymans var. lacrymans S7.3]|uniref:Uncharacterized protein n=1 Tax=Serpula lacrymans var. lacrymans (strain S7.3) TaxID=936435 RepID=F8PSQ1_SERL3|nr:hypothetical protein SERLA73DRAFT_72275 [Serpula lacrymans var. lacrymans S7.3]